ncbi:DUF1488 domain-containing protein [Paraburkholderia sp. MMS20-SJTR3]|uniref:DUF1488 domain-containing protein n=1 Tax=Paraburkholderia sejongensis TaxID=2886946 RepID=A0ABS8K582_9BURK|nr:DUF1488 domain-containing protein [Paraburkholderia sp. MMS20-SJTR3]MCC8397322.1 DUF1488 domain-containing protein [Paraburkholderia sp. MMS20-SJTR3]
MKIQFPAKPAIYTENTTVAFQALVDGEALTREVSTEALQDHFGATTAYGSDLVATFEANRAAIEAVAMAKLPQRVDAGRYLLTSADF